MKFRNFNIEDVFSSNDAEQAKAYIGKKGYYADYIEDLDDYIENKSHIDKLYSIDEAHGLFHYVVGCSYDYSGNYNYFLPLEKVKKTEPAETKVTYRYRPFKTIDELEKVLNKDNRSAHQFMCVGNDIFIRNKNQITHLIITRIDRDAKTNEVINVNGMSPIFLFNNYEIRVGAEWLPFGVEVKDE